MKDIDLSITPIEEIMKMQSGIYFGKTQQGEPSIIRVSKTDPRVRIQILQDNNIARICEYYSDGTSRKYTRE